jgi:predicted enzyme related to lactoylglutathione lyase
MPRVVHFEIAADDPARATRFYGDVFGWQFTRWEGPQEYWLVKTGDGHPGIDGGVLRRREGMPRTTNTVDVESVDDAIARISRAGGKVVVPKMAVPGVGWLAYCADPDGAVFGIMQADPTAG